MLRIYGDILSLLADLRELQSSIETSASNEPLDEESRNQLQRILTKCGRSSVTLDMADANNRIQRIQKMLGPRSRGCSSREVIVQIRTLHETIEDSLKDRHFWYLSKERDRFLSDAPKIPMDEQSPDSQQAQYDWNEAIWCYALDRHTACVNHLMRLIEVGLRTLGRHLDIELRRAIEFEDWRPILEAVDRKLVQLSNEQRTEGRTRDLEFYAEAARQMRYFKDIWRDSGAHARGRYDRHEAERALESVRHFMTMLFEKLNSVSK